MTAALTTRDALVRELRHYIGAHADIVANGLIASGAVIDASDRPDGMPPGIEAASLAAAQAAVPNWDDLPLQDQRSIQNTMLPIVEAACRAQIATIRGAMIGPTADPNGESR